ncbi:DMT family transporter [Cellulomonas sp. URHE0023]|uniref:EamA family transporter n=1 Tax=Cellulomonas sp. URHE0023 TaxID=1380354 RepID=UPI0005519B3E|nr:EamA family transporter [Cellulomonas sp. URHE0023]
MPAPLLFALSGLTQYLGAAVAVRVFGTLAPATVAWLRITIAALVLLLWRRPWRARGLWTWPSLRTAIVFGIVLALMNVAFYVALDHLPLGTAVSIEFLGPVAVAAVTGHGWRDRVGIGVAAIGVVLLAGVSLSAGPDATVGLVAILVAAACWAAYILLGRRVAHGRAGGVTGLAVAMSAGAVVFAPFLSTGALPVLHDGRLALLVVAIAVCSSVVPYAIEQVVLRRVRAATFAVLLAMLPAMAGLVGAVVLRQVPHGLEVLGLLLVTGAIVLTGLDSEDQLADEAPTPA